MIVKNEKLLAEFRGLLFCSWCKRPRQCVPHHISARGMGGGKRLDIRINLVSLCDRCHTDHHMGHAPLTCDLLAIVAQRETTTQDAIRREMQRLRKAGKP